MPSRKPSNPLLALENEKSIKNNNFILKISFEKNELNLRQSIEMGIEMILNETITGNN